MEDKCLYGEIAGASDEYVCYTREQWLAESPKNYIDDDFRPETYDVDITPSVTAEDLCDVQGSILVEGRICACPIEMYEEEVYDDSGHYLDSKCVMLPKTLNGNLLLDVKYTFNGVEHL